MVSKNVWVVIPAYNESSVIQTTIKDVLNFFQNVVVVDDHSPDCTARLAYESGATVCRHPINLGQGAALQTGITYALSQGASHIITFDADGQHSIHDAMNMVDTLDKTQVDVVLGSRFLGANPIGMTRSKRVLLAAATFFTRITSGLSVTDTHNGLRCLSAKAAKEITIKHNRMAHASELLNQIGKLKLKYVESPCTITYTDYSKAKGQRLTGAFKILYDLSVGKLYK